MYQPKQGDIVMLYFDPTAGHEQAGYRPALVVWGNDTLERIPGLAQVCAISNTDNGFPLHVPLDADSTCTTGFVLCEQNKVLDLNARHVKFRDRVSEKVLQEVLNILRAMID
ncbi:type II toxin-antitoxin system PemK/MazF family toxin [Flavonifractor sp. An306]|uniref:type II toxin-antitoxin system PemK/MazF family toxin n=1 Tax=Flavonifractor sp. An306 TaxID=1965629 RepID=UPI000B38DBB7|nr:type II toxin-antitoxin system PemK/MazF family toxin [Flavonifractor sp. An306]OUO36401.1 toxin MazF [Flavonifractor sp. An306]